MFKNEFQGGPSVEVFSAQRKEPVSQWKLVGVSNSNKVFDQDVKSYVFYLEGTNISTKMQLPKDSKQNLSLIQPYLVLQVFITKGEDFSLDIGVYDESNSTKRRLGLSTTYKEFHVTTLNSKIPMTLVHKSVWLNLCIDLASLVSETWKGHTYKSLESICVGGHCKLRRIFTMRAQPYDSTNDDEICGCPSTNSHTDLESIPRQCVLPPDLTHETQIVNMTKIIRCMEGKNKFLENHRTGSELDLSANSRKGQDEYHIAFGKKVPGSAPQSRKGSGKENERGGSGKSERRSAGKEGSERRMAAREGGEGTDKRGKDEELSNQESKNHHSRSKSDSSDGNVPRRMPHLQKADKLPLDSSSNRKPSKSHSNNQRRTRRDSDPGASQNDPDITVDKDSLRSSHTWTDGADGQEAIPFVKPHPPSKPSSAKHRRPVRIKSAGKERTPHAGHVHYKGWDSASQSSNPTPPTKSPQSGFFHNPPEVMVMANDDEMENILKAMQMSAQRELAMEEDRLCTDSDNTSGVHEGDESINDVIQALNGNRLDDDVTGGEHELSEEDYLQSQDHTVYSFSSAPRQAPKYTTREHYQTKNVVKSHRTRVRKRQKPSNKKENDTLISNASKMGGGDGRSAHVNNTTHKNKTLTRSQSDFIRNASSDDEEVDVIQERQEAAQKRRSPRGKQSKKFLNSAYNSSKTVTPAQYSSPGKQQNYNLHQRQSHKQLHLKTSSDEIDSSTYTKENLSPYSRKQHKFNNEPLQIPLSAHSPHMPECPIYPSSGYGSHESSQTRISFNKRALREIPDHELKLRKSGGSRQYNPDIYKMGSESMENSMLYQLKNISDDSDEEKKKSSTLTSTRQSLTRFRVDGSDSDETMTSTLKSEKEHNYFDEMQKNTFYNEDPFTMSGPRVFSPEIVLPSQKPKMNQVPPQRLYQDKNIHSNSGNSSEDELELLYDYVLQLYYDPRTNIFYQLI